MNARCVLLELPEDTHYMEKKENTENYEITSIEIDPGSLNRVYTVGEEFTVGKNLFKLNKIKYIGRTDRNNVAYELLYSVMNNSMYFLAPLLFSTQEESLVRYMVNTFLIYKGEFEEMTLYLLYRHIPEKRESLLFNKLVEPSSPLTVVEHLIPDEYHTILKVKLHDSYREVYDLIMEGSYSKLHERTKEKILDFHRAKPDSALYKALYRDPVFQKRLEENLELDYGTLDNQELWTAMNFEKENYSEEYYQLSTSYGKWTEIA